MNTITGLKPYDLKRKECRTNAMHFVGGSAVGVAVVILCERPIGFDDFDDRLAGGNLRTHDGVDSRGPGRRIRKHSAPGLHSPIRTLYLSRA
jgi:hypothetical protein